MERRPPPGRRGQGKGQDRARESDARHHHLPELLPQVRQALGHDRHRGDGSRRVREDLQARRHRRPAEPAARPQGRAGQRLSDRAREAGSHPHRHRQPAGVRPADARRHGLDREVREAERHAQAAWHQAHRPEREVSRAGSRDRRAGRPAGRRDDCHEHGRPRHRHSARREPGVHGPTAVPGGSGRRAAPEGPGEVRRRRRVRLLLSSREFLSGAARRLRAHFERVQGADGRRARRGRRPRRAPHHRHGAARSAAHRQPVARTRRPSGRSGILALLPVARRRPDAHLRIGPHRRSDAAPRHGRRRADRARHGHEGDRARAAAGRSPELLDAQTSPRVRRRHEQAA